jgi:beta-lactamase class D
MKTKYFSLEESAKALKISLKDLKKDIKKGYYPNKKLCDCDAKQILISSIDLQVQMLRQLKGADNPVQQMKQQLIKEKIRIKLAK